MKLSEVKTKLNKVGFKIFYVKIEGDENYELWEMRKPAQKVVKIFKS